MKRRLASLLGIVMVGLTGAYLAVFGPSVLTGPLAVVVLGGFVLSAILLIVGGLVDSVTIGGRVVSWNALVGIGDVVLATVVGLSAVRSALGTGDAGSWLFAAAMVAGGSSLARLGVQIARNGRRVDLEATPSSRRLVAIVSVVAISFAIGLFLAMNP